MGSSDRNVPQTVAELIDVFDALRALVELMLHALLLGVDGRVRGVGGQIEQLWARAGARTSKGSEGENEG